MGTLGWVIGIGFVIVFLLFLVLVNTRLHNHSSIKVKGSKTILPPGFGPDLAEAQQWSSQSEQNPQANESLIHVYERMLRKLNPGEYLTFRADIFIDLGTAYRKRQRGNQEENLARAIECYKEALSIHTPDTTPLDYALAQHNLGNAYRDYSVGDRDANLEQAITCYQEALRIWTPEIDPMKYATTQNNLATVYSELTTGDKAVNLTKAIQCLRETLRFWTPKTTPLKYAIAQNNLGLAYANLPTGDRSTNLEQAINCYQEALCFRTQKTLPLGYKETSKNLRVAYVKLIKHAISKLTDPSEWNALLGQPTIADMLSDEEINIPPDFEDDVTEAFRLEYQKLRDPDPQIITRLIQIYERILKKLPIRHSPSLFALTQYNLGNAYRASPTTNVLHMTLASSKSSLGSAYPTSQVDRGVNLQRAINCYKEALRIWEPETFPLAYAATRHNLGNTYRDLPTGDLSENLHRAINCYKETIRFFTSEIAPLEYAMAKNNMGSAYLNLPTGDRSVNLKKAIECYSDALQFRTIEAAPLEYARTRHNLGSAYYHLSSGNYAENLEQAISHYEEALRFLTSEFAPFEYASIQNGLGNAYAALPTGDQRMNLEKAIKHFQEALRFRTSTGAPFYYAMTQHNMGNAYHNLATGNPDDAASHANLARAIACYEQALRFRTPEAEPGGHRGTQHDLGNLYFEQGHWEQAMIAYRGALDASELLYQAAALPVARQAVLHGVHNLTGRLAYSIARQEPALQLQDAVLSIEQNRARWLHESLSLQEEKPAAVPQPVWETFTTRREEVRQLQAQTHLPEGTPGKPSYLELSDTLAQARQQLQAAIAQVQASASDFMPTPGFADIQAAAAQAPLVYIVATPASGLALIVKGDQIMHVWLDALTDEALRERVQDYLGAYSRWRSEHSHKAHAAWLEAINETTRWLWDVAMGPVIEILTDLGGSRATLIPTGLLSLLPPHAAWTETGGDRRYAMDEICFTYSPNARALSAARQTAARISPDRLFAIDEPQPVSANPLPNANAEASAACEHFTHRKVLAGEAATALAVRDQLPHHTVLHFSCHGFAAPTQPLEGGLLMAHDEILTLRDILALRLENVRLAILSACETGIPGTELLDEVISLPTGLAQAGIAGVVASLWSVSDLSTMMLMARFYELWKQDGLEPPQALRQAQLWLRDTTNAQKADYFQTFLPTSDTARLLARPDENDFEHPFYWAAFTYTGV